MWVWGNRGFLGVGWGGCMGILREGGGVGKWEGMYFIKYELKN